MNERNLEFFLETIQERIEVIEQRNLEDEHIGSFRRGQVNAYQDVIDQFKRIMGDQK